MNMTNVIEKNILFANISNGIETIYQSDILPRQFDGYIQASCLKHDENSQVYLVEKDGEKYILKHGAGYISDVLAEEYERLKNSNFSFAPKPIDFFQTDNESWLIREYIEGRTLYDIAETREPYAEHEAVNAVIPVIDLIGEMHSQNPPVIYRDMKPQNIIITPDGKYKIIDMGSARNWSKEKENDTIYSGTLATAAPEQFGYSQTDARTDIYALGILLLFLLTGDLSRDSIGKLNVSKKLRVIIQKCIEFDPKRRYRNIDELKKALLKSQKNNNFIKIIPVIFISVILICGFLLYQAKDNNNQLDSPFPYLLEGPYTEFAPDWGALKGWQDWVGVNPYYSQEVYAMADIIVVEYEGTLNEGYSVNLLTIISDWEWVPAEELSRSDGKFIVDKRDIRAEQIVLYLPIHEDYAKIKRVYLDVLSEELKP